MSEKPGRYQTSMGAMVGAMLVLVVAVLAFVLLRDLNRESAETTVDPLDWEEAVVAAQGAGHAVVHPGELPEGWKVTSLAFTPTDPPVWGMGMLTDEDRYVGIRQEDDRVEDLLEVFVDEDTSEEEPVRVGGELAGEWQVFTDAGGDTALVRERDGDVVLVYGSAPREVVEELASRLTEAPL
ncbi:DUF4245 domain-containing protein [Nocardioides solisilvae]|uniref:DUF4245 domain-containing protein n=1 Tax=Nocardioides solisilvae TaxID=1542435 RepID=UPI0013A549EB|nr:DUF4245 domain-containing protein [Nocardioides solisilvae]